MPSSLSARPRCRPIAQESYHPAAARASRQEAGEGGVVIIDLVAPAGVSSPRLRDLGLGA